LPPPGIEPQAKREEWALNCVRGKQFLFSFRLWGRRTETILRVFKPVRKYEKKNVMSVS
jgi:hypothetical protein